MEGMNALVMLRDLSLFHNQIKKVSGLDKCKKLEYLSLGDNQIDVLSGEEGVCTYLRQFSHLKSLNLNGNPITNLSGYRETVIKSLHLLKYLDNTALPKLNHVLDLQEDTYQNTKIHHSSNQLHEDLNRSIEQWSEYNLIESLAKELISFLSCANEQVEDIGSEIAQLALHVKDALRKLFDSNALYKASVVTAGGGFDKSVKAIETDGANKRGHWINLFSQKKKDALSTMNIEKTTPMNLVAKKEIENELSTLNSNLLESELAQMKDIENLMS
eukprot:11974562-Ditylum_brightwellii.AAC.1